MVVVMKERASEEQIEKVVAHLVELGLDVHRSTGVEPDRASGRWATAVGSTPG